MEIIRNTIEIEIIKRRKNVSKWVRIFNKKREKKVDQMVPWLPHKYSHHAHVAVMNDNFSAVYKLLIKSKRSGGRSKLCMRIV